MHKLCCSCMNVVELVIVYTYIEKYGSIAVLFVPIMTFSNVYNIISIFKERKCGRDEYNTPFVLDDKQQHNTTTTTSTSNNTHRHTHAHIHTHYKQREDALTRSIAHSLIHSLTHSIAHSFTHSLTHSLTYCSFSIKWSRSQS